MKQVEVWREVTKLCSRNSRWEIVGWYYFPKGIYYVSNFGRFKRKGKIISNKADSVGTITISMKRHRFKLHEIVLQVFKPDGNVSGCSPDHISRNRKDNSFSNLIVRLFISFSILSPFVSDIINQHCYSAIIQLCDKSDSRLLPVCFRISDGVRP